MAFTNSSSSSQDQLPIGSAAASNGEPVLGNQFPLPQGQISHPNRYNTDTSSNENDNDENNQEPKFSMDADSRQDMDEFRDYIVARRQSFQSLRKDIQSINYTHSPLLKLPTEVLLQIFHYLERRDLYSLLTVCREFADLIIEILWFRPNMQNDGSFKKIKSIMMQPRNQTHWDYRAFIKRLNLSFMTKLVDDSLLSLFIGCPKLERLTLVNCTKLTHIPITKVLQNCEKLQSIDLTGVTDIHDDIIYALARNCTRLQGLYAPGCGAVSEEAILNLLISCPMLKRVKFNNCENLTDESILYMYNNCKSLVEIDLHNCPNVTDKYLKQIFLDLSQLREFRISNASGITDKLFELIPGDHFLEKLRIIDITGCNAITDRLVEKLVRCAPRLRNVVLSKCMQITDASLRALALLGRSLHYVHLGHCGLITDFGVQSLVRACHRIQYIDLACCSQLTDWTLIELATLPKLRRIGLVKCNLITDSGILELVRRRGEQDCLERVHLSYCTNLTIGPIFMLLKNCPKLTHLSLTGIASFLRREITQYCREPPPDFNEYQRTSFCVFSGQGVNRLRDHLNRVLEDRTYLVEQEDFNNTNAIERRRRANGVPIPPIEVGAAPAATATAVATGLNDNNDAFMNANARPINFRNNAIGNTRTATNFSGDGVQVPVVPFDEMSAWASQRGLGVLQDSNAQSNDEEMEFLNREIFRELSEGNMAPEEMREHFQGLLHNYYRQRRWVAELQASGEEARVEDAMRNVRAMGRQRQPRFRGAGDNNNVRASPTNAPQFAQPPVFPNEGGAAANEDEDIQMEVDLFPRRQHQNPTS